MSERSLSDIFSADGPLASLSEGYRVRPSQVELARAVEQTIESGGTLVAEAGTGTGKTWAYLVPALLGSGKVLVSTGTRTLQDQLFGRDLPRVREALGVPASIALLKGRANYVCHYHLDRLQGLAIVNVLIFLALAVLFLNHLARPAGRGQAAAFGKQPLAHFTLSRDGIR